MTRSRRLMIYALLALTALIIGRYVETPSPIQVTREEEVPDNIDFYLSGVDYRAMDDRGELRYRIQSPLLEHYRLEDISQVQQPVIEYRLGDRRWQLQAGKAEMQHRRDRLILDQAVQLQREGGSGPMQLDTEQLILQTRKQLVRLPVALRLQSSRLRLEADSGRLQLDDGKYRFNGVRAVYQNPEART